MFNYSIIFFCLILSKCFVHTLSYGNKNDEDNLIRRKKAVLTNKFKWNLPIRYFVDYFLYNQKVVEEAIQRIENKTCITFKRDYWYIKGTKGFNILPTYYYCFSPFGPKLNDENYENNILVSPKCQNSVGMVEGLIGTMLGLLSEVDRPDRDNFIEINYENIYYDAKSYYNKYNKGDIETYDTGYDFLSALHFFPKNFSRNEKLVIKPKGFYTNYEYSMGQTKGLSFNDYKVLAHRYCKRKYYIHCHNYGYPDPKKDNKCICPSGFTGDKCEQTIQNHRLCSETNLKANFYTQGINVGRIGVCSYFINSDTRLKIKLTVLESKTKEQQGCTEGMGVEIKYRKDKGVGGVCLCGSYKNLTFVSESYSMVIIYNGLTNSDKLTFQYQLETKSKDYFKPYESNKI